MNIGLLLSGCGVYDGAEIQEAIFSMLAIEEIGATVVPISIDQEQNHVINHLTGEVTGEKRNMMVEAARITRGNVSEINSIDISTLDAVVIPGGFGSAKNFTTWAFDGPAGTINDAVKKFILAMHGAKKPILALCVSPVVVAKAFENSGVSTTLTIGSSTSPSPYTISDFEAGIVATGAKTEQANLGEVALDEENKIISAPCYMMEASLLDVKNNISNAINVLKSIL